MMLFNIVFAMVMMVVTGVSSEGFKKVCYFTSWSQYRQGAAKFVPEDIDPTLCTHIIYAFAYVDNRANDDSGLKTYEWNDVEMYGRINSLKQQNPSLKTLLAVGGWTHGSKLFSDMANSVTKRSNFVTNSIAYLKQYGFDGLDLDWEYPAQRDSSHYSTDKAAFVELCKDLRAGFEQEALSSGNPRLLLTAAVGCGPWNIDTSYDVAAISNDLDFINLMTYDLAGQWDGKTGIHGALHSGPGDTTGLSQDWSVSRFLELNAPKEKLVLGIPLYGRSFKLSSSSSAIGAPAATWGAISGPYTAESGFMSYYEICAKIKAGWAEIYDAQRDDPYAYSGSDWVGFSDKYSVAKKAEFIKENGLGGAMIWALDLDNFNKDSLCNTDAENFALLKTINDVLEDGVTVTTTTKATTTTEEGATTTTSATSSSSTTTASSTNEGFCTQKTDGPHRDPTNCSSFISCRGGIMLGISTCGTGTLYSDVCQCCDWDYNVDCASTESITTSTTSTTTQTKPVTTTITTTTTSKATTTRNPTSRATVDIENFCFGKRGGLYRDPNNCANYISCWNGINYGTTTCPSGTLFSEVAGFCDWDYNVDCSTVVPSTIVQSTPLTSMKSVASTSTEHTATSASFSSSTLPGASATTPQEQPTYKRVCYFTNWAQYRVSPGKFFPSDIDPYLCTHIVYSFGKVVNGPEDESTIEPYEWNDVSTLYPAMMALKTINPNLKILLAIGGWTHGSGPFTELVASSSKLNNFVRNSIYYLRFHGFDGLDLDWEYPALRGGVPADRARFVDLCRELRNGFEYEAIKSNRETMLLTAAVGCGKDTIDAAYDIDGFTPYLDFINLMSYDLAGQWDGRTGIHAALHPRTGDPDPTLTQEYAVNRFIQEGAPPEKLILGIPLYGRTFRLSTSDTGLGAPAATYGAPSGPVTNEAGFMSYYEICQKIVSGWTYEYDTEHDDSYAFSGSNWVGYTDTIGIQAKVDFIKEMRLGGAMVWSLDLDDFSGNLCSLSQERYPLLNAVKSGLTT